MASVEEVKTGLTGVDQRLAEATPAYARAQDVLDTTVLDDAAQKIFEGAQILAALARKIADGEGALSGIERLAANSSVEVTYLAVVEGEEPHEAIGRTLGGLARTKAQAQEFSRETAAIRNGLVEAAGYLYAFGKAMEEVADTVVRAVDATQEGFEATSAAREGIRDYVGEA